MLSYDKVKNKPNLLLAMTSLKKAEFDQLLVEFEHARQVELEKSTRQRQAGGGRKPALSRREDQLFFILFYLILN